MWIQNPDSWKQRQSYYWCHPLQSNCAPPTLAFPSSIWEQDELRCTRSAAPPWYASLVSNQIKPTCDQPKDKTNIQTVYIWEDLPSISPWTGFKPPHRASLMKERCISGEAFNSEMKASDVAHPQNPNLPPSNPWESFSHSDICLFLTSHTRCWWC